MLTLPPSIIEETRNTMTDVFVIRNQLGHYWAKSKTWVDGSEARAVMRAKHEDEAVNTLFELGSKDFELRGEVVAAELSERGEPIIEASQIPLLLEQEAEPASDADADASLTADEPTENSAEALD
jgi:hypothetical protein